MKSTIALLRSAAAALLCAFTFPSAGIATDVDEGASARLDALAALYQSAKGFSVKVTSETAGTGAAATKVEATITVKKPQQLLAVVKAAPGTTTIVSDGAKLFVFEEKTNSYFKTAAPASIAPTLAECGPGLDSLLAANPRTKILEDVLSVKLAGEETYGGALCQRLHFSQKGGEVNVWIEKGAKPLVRGLRVEGPDKSAQLEVHYDDWQLDPETAPATFQFTPPADAKEIQPK